MLSFVSKERRTCPGVQRATCYSRVNDDPSGGRIKGSGGFVIASGPSAVAAPEGGASNGGRVSSPFAPAKRSRQRGRRGPPASATPPTLLPSAATARAVFNLAATPLAPRPAGTPRRRAPDAKRRATPCLALLDQIGSQWIALHVPQHRQEVIVFLDREGLEPALV